MKYEHKQYAAPSKPRTVADLDHSPAVTSHRPQIPWRPGLRGGASGGSTRPGCCVRDGWYRCVQVKVAEGHYRQGQGQLAFQFIRHAYYRCLGDARLRTHRAFDFPSAQPVAGHVDDIVGAAQDEVVAIFVANATVEGCMVEAARKMVKDFPRPPLEGIAVPGGAAEVASSYS